MPIPARAIRQEKTSDLPSSDEYSKRIHNLKPALYNQTISISEKIKTLRMVQQIMKDRTDATQVPGIGKAE